MVAAAQKGSVSVRVALPGDVRRACDVFRRFAGEVGLSGVDVALAETAISEIAQNLVTHGGGGKVRVSVARDAGRVGVMVVACDSGPGIDDLSLAMAEGFSTGGGLGLGLPGAQRLMDEFAVEKTPGGGTTVTMTKWSRR